MQRSSETVGTIAGALAKARQSSQIPRKSLVATIRTDGPGAVERSFRMRRSPVGSRSYVRLESA